MGVLLGTIRIIGRLVARFVSASVMVNGLEVVLTTGRLETSPPPLTVRVSTFLVRLLWVALAGFVKLRQVHSCFPSL